MRLPVILERNIATLPQERYNTTWVEENEVGVVLDSFSNIDSGVTEIQKNYWTFFNKIRSIDNRAIFEIPEIIGKII